MSSTTFVDGVTVVKATWLNDVNTLTYNFAQPGTGAATRTASSKLQEIVSASDFGAVGDGVTDDTAALQNAIDYVMYSASKTKRLSLPAGIYKTSDTLHLGYGYNSFTTIELVGEDSYGANQSTKLTGIFPTFNDRPALNIQGGRRIVIKDLYIQGVNYNWLYTNYTNITDRSSIANWYGPNISATNNTQYAPYAGICVDAYSGTQPTVHYPAVTYPSFLGTGIAQYGKNYSSTIVLDNVGIEGFVTGVCVQPNAMPDGSNGDFLTVRDCNINFNIVNYADGHADARNINILNSRLHFAHTVFDSLTYGNKRGSMSVSGNGSSFDNCFRIFNVNIRGYSVQGGYSINLNSCYGESIYSIGNCYITDSDKPTGVSLYECKFQFSLKGTEKTPIYIYTAPGTDLYLRNVIFLGSYGFYLFNANIKAETFTIDQLIVDAFPTDSPGRIAKTYSCGIFAPKSWGIRMHPHRFYNYFGGSLSNAIDSNGIDIDMNITAAGGTDYSSPIPWFTDQLKYGTSRYPVSNINPLTLNRATYNLSSTTLVNNSYTFTVQTGFITDGQGAVTDPQFSVGTGDLVSDSTTGQMFYVSAVSVAATTMTLTLYQLNNIINTIGTTFVAGGSFSSTVGNLVFYNARRVYPSSYKVSLTSTAGSGAIVHKICGDEANVTFMTLPVRVNDYVISNNFSQSVTDSLFPKFTKVTAVNISTGSVTVNQNARRSYYGDTFLYVRAGF